MKYTKEYFIKKFSELRDDEIGVGNIMVQHCTLYHCGMMSMSDFTEEAEALIDLIRPFVSSKVHILSGDMFKDEIIWKVNDDTRQIYFIGETPRQRMLNVLNSI